MKGVLLRSCQPHQVWQQKVDYHLTSFEGLIADDVITDLVALFCSVYSELQWNEETVRKIFVEDNRVKKVWTAYSRGNLIAVMAAQVISENGPDSVNVHWLSVHPSFRRRGLAAMLIGELWQWAKEQDKDTLFAYSTTFTPEVAAFYRDLGFVEV